VKKLRLAIASYQDADRYMEEYYLAELVASGLRSINCRRLLHGGARAGAWSAPFG